MLLSARQIQVVEYMGHCLGVACPGSGKSRVLVQKVLHILKEDDAAKTLMVSFTQDSAAELKNRVLKHEGVVSAARKVHSGTFHSLAYQQLKRANIERKVLSPGQLLSYAQRAHKECKGAPPVEKDSDLLSIIESLKVTPGYEPDSSPEGRLYAAYQKLMERNKVIDFTDMLAMSVNMMRSGEIEPIKCNHLLVDEAQDLDDLQFAWCVEHIKKGAIVTVVGDDDQSIYKFRRALGYKGMMRFVDQFNAHIIQLDTNYRCRPEIMSAAGEVIKNNTNRVKKSLHASRDAGGVVEAWQCSSAGDEAILVIKRILEISAGNPLLPPTKKKERDKKGAVVIGEGDKPNIVDYYYSVGVRPLEWAVLARNNFNLRILAGAMLALGIPHKYSGKNVWSEQPVCFAISLLVSLVTKQQAGFDTALHCAGLEEGTIEMLHADFQGDYFEMLSQLTYAQGMEKKYSKSVISILNDFNKHVMNWQKAINNGKHAMVVAGVFKWFISTLPMMHQHEKANDSARKYARDSATLISCMDILVEKRGDIMERLAMLLGNNDDDNEGKDEAQLAREAINESRVTLGTLHSSKGLEYENVWMLSMDAGIMPSLKLAMDAGEGDIEEIREEERRLFYVGMTRAKDRLFISCTGSPSPFIAETGLTLNDAADAFEGGVVVI